MQSKDNQKYLSAFTVLLRYDDSLMVFLFSNPPPSLPPPWFCPLLSSSRAQLRRELRGCLQGLNSCTESLRASEKSLCECQENLQRSHLKCSEKTESVRQLQAKVWTGDGPQCILVLSTPVWPLGGVIAPPGPDLDPFHYPFPAVKLDIHVSACLCCAVCCPHVGFCFLLLLSC